MRRVAVFTVRTKDLLSLLRLCTASTLSQFDWDTSAPFVRYSTPLQELTPLSDSRVFPPRCSPIVAADLEVPPIAIALSIGVSAV